MPDKFGWDNNFGNNPASSPRKKSTLAQQFLLAWHKQAKTISAKTLVKRIDPRVKRIDSGLQGTHYWQFSDRSSIRVSGRGSRHKLEICP